MMTSTYTSISSVRNGLKKKRNRNKHLLIYHKLNMERASFKDVLVLWNRNKYLRRKYRLANMHPVKKVIWRLDNLIADIDMVEQMSETDLNYWKQVKEHLDACKIITEEWRQEFNRTQGTRVRQKSLRTVLIENPP